MRKIVILLFFCVFSLVGFSRTVHTVIFGDTNDKSIGSGVSANVRNFSEWAGRISNALEAEGYSSKNYTFTGSDCNKDKLLGFVNNLDCNDDIVLFYYGGHGGRSVGDSSEFPRMCLGSSDPSRFVPVSELQETLAAKSPFFTIILSDCCNSFYDGDLPQSMMMPMCDQPASPKYSSERIRQLFGNKGTIVGTGATKGEYGWINSLRGGFFTTSFLESFDFSMGRKKEQPSWTVILADTRDLTFDKSNQAYIARRITKTQTPVFDIRISSPVADNKPKPDSEKRPDPVPDIRPDRTVHTVRYADGTVYKGEMSAEKRNGMGKLTIDGKDVFVGEFKDDTIEGGGIYLRGGDSYYIGAWHDGKLSGYGMDVDNGKFTCQYWLDGELVGRNPVIEKPRYIAYSNGYYLGEVKDGVPHGNGKYVWNNGSSFEGTWVDGLVNGSGVLSFPNNLGFFIGFWEDGRRVRCYGFESLPGGHTVVGLWENECYRGKGLLSD